METFNCRFCGNKLLPSRIFEIQGKNLSLYACPKCALIQSKSSKIDYSSGDLVSYYEERKEWISRRHSYIFDTVEKLINPKKDKSFLDIGCGIGFSLKEAQRRNWNASGIEPNKDLALYGQKQISKNILNDYFPSQLLDGNNFDFILIDNVIEHLEEPRKLIESALNLLSDEGILLVAVPPVDWLRILLSKFSYVRDRISSATVNMFNDTYEHINFVRKDSMTFLAQELNFEILDFEFHHHKRMETLQKIMFLDSGYFFIRKKS